MSSRLYPSTPLLGACTAIWRDNRALLVQRRKPPNHGRWATPGGLVEVGEPLMTAAKREVREETSLQLGDLAFNRFHEVIRRDSAGAVEHHYVLAMFVALSEDGDPVAGDDAAEVDWFTLDEAECQPLTDQTMVFLRESLAFLPQLAGQ